MTLSDEFSSHSATFDDIPMIIAMLNQTTSESQDSFFVEDMKTEWLTPDFNVSDSVQLVFSADNQLVGYVEVWDIDNPPVRPTIWGRVHPDFTRQGIGTYLMTWAENRAKQAISRCSDDIRIAYQCGCDTHNIGTQKLFESLGLHY